VEAPTKSIDLTTASWADGEAERYLAAQSVDRTVAGHASGFNGAVTVAYGGYAARAGLEALKQGGGALDAAMTAALAQVALTGGAPVSYFGIMSLVYYEAKTGKVHTMNAEWNTVAGEDDPMSIPGGIAFGSDEALKGKGPPSGRTALVGGFLKGVEAAHQRFGKLPFASLFGPSIELAEKGFPMDHVLHGAYLFRADDLARLPATRDVFFKPDGSRYAKGEIFAQPKLAETLRRVAAEGTDHIYGGEWGEKLVAAVRADGGKMTLDDLRAYEVIWADALVGEIGGGYSVATTPWPNAGGIALIEAQNLAEAAGLGDGEHWTRSAASLRKVLDISLAMNLMLFHPELLAQAFPGVDFSPEARITKRHARILWPLIDGGSALGQWKQKGPLHSDDVVAVDGEGNMAAITQSINCVHWGKTTINVEGISIGDPASYQQALIANTVPGGRLPAPTETGVVLKDGKAVLGFASMGAGLHVRTLQGLLNFTRYGMDVEEAINTADVYLPSVDLADGSLTVAVPEGRFDKEVLDGTGYLWREVPLEEARLGGEGKWVAISRDPDTGELEAASHNRNNSDAVAY
jgi:gamma-glutamyltranspeptidase/glutathione hydrolase